MEAKGLLPLLVTVTLARAEDAGLADDGKNWAHGRPWARCEPRRAGLRAFIGCSSGCGAS